MTMTANEVTIGLAKHYGVHVCYLGEDGEEMLAFTGHPRRALAALNAYVREECGDRLADLYDIAAVQVLWAVFHDTCGCQHDDPSSCRADLNGAVTCCRPDPEDADDPVEDIVEHDCPRWGLPPCSDEYGWVVTWSGVTAETPGAVQVCRVRQ